MYGIKRRHKDEWFQGFDANGTPVFGPKENAHRDPTEQLAKLQAMALRMVDGSVQQQVKRI